MKKTVSLMLLVAILMSSFGVLSLGNEKNDYEKYYRIGLTDYDLEQMHIIAALSNHNILEEIAGIYLECKNWRIVRKVCGVTEEEYEKYLKDQETANKLLEEIPLYIREEMKEMGWTSQQIFDFSNRTRISDIDYGYAWEECKKGRTLIELQQEKQELNKKVSALINEYVNNGADKDRLEDGLKNIGFSRRQIIGKMNYVLKNYREKAEENKHKAEKKNSPFVNSSTLFVTMEVVKK